MGMYTCMALSHPGRSHGVSSAEGAGKAVDGWRSAAAAPGDVGRRLAVCGGGARRRRPAPGVRV